MKLRVYDADPERVERIRTRCLSVVRSQGRAVRTRRVHTASWRSWLEPAVAVGLGVLYLAQAVTLAEAVTRAVVVYR